MPAGPASPLSSIGGQHIDKTGHQTVEIPFSISFQGPEIRVGILSSIVSGRYVLTQAKVQKHGAVAITNNILRADDSMEDIQSVEILQRRQQLSKPAYHLLRRLSRCNPKQRPAPKPWQ